MELTATPVVKCAILLDLCMCIHPVGLCLNLHHRGIVDQVASLIWFKVLNLLTIVFVFLFGFMGFFYFSIEISESILSLTMYVLPCCNFQSCIHWMGCGKKYLIMEVVLQGRRSRKIWDVEVVWNISFWWRDDWIICLTGGLGGLVWVSWIAKFD